MIKCIKLMEECIYNLFVGFWLPMIIEFFIGCLLEGDEGEEYATFLLGLFSLTIYLILLIPVNLVFYKSNKDSKVKKILPIISLVLGGSLYMFFRLTKGVR